MYFRQYEMDISGAIPIPTLPEDYVFAYVVGEAAPVPVRNGVTGYQIYTLPGIEVKSLTTYANMNNERKQYAVSRYGGNTPPNLQLILLQS